LVALVAAAAVFATLAPDTLGPGVTCDELYHVNRGKELITAFRQQGVAFFLPSNIGRNFAWQPGDAPVQAPLGYWILGGVHHVFDPSPDEPAVLSIAAARFAPAIAFVLLILIVGVWTTRREGALAGTVAAVAMLLMPRLFAHAHLASLDTLTTFFFVTAVLAIAEASRSGRTLSFVLASIVWGAAILVRLHGLLVAPPVVLWLLGRFGKKSLRPILTWALSGVSTVFVGWPWLWLAPLTHFRYFLSSGTGRESIHVFYAGQVWADRDVPWHYPWVIFLVTVPLGLLLLGMLGGWAKTTALLHTDGRKPTVGNLVSRLFSEEYADETLLGGSMAFVLLLFSLPQTPVYDGERLFLMAFPFLAIWIGIGAKWLCEKTRLARWPNRLRYGMLAVFLALQTTGLILYYPCHLSYYNALVGGLWGAEKLGFEISYWGDVVREPMLAEAVRRSDGKPVALAPNLAPFQAVGIQISSPAFHEAKTALVGGDAGNFETLRDCRYAIIYHRRADLAAADPLLKHGREVLRYEKQGVWLVKLVELDAPLDVRTRHN
jgi:hypothetical protein